MGESIQMNVEATHSNFSLNASPTLNARRWGIERKERRGGMERLAEEVVSSVLSRLPAKDLVRCKCVCKSWFDLITDPHFITNYYVFYNSSREEEHLLVLRKPFYLKAESSVLSWNLNDPKGLVSSQVLNIPSQYCLGIMGPCNGIYFLTEDPYVMMNPSLGQFMAISKSHFTSPHGTYSEIDFPRFGFDPETNDYKVVVLTDLWLEETGEELMGKWTVDLYSLNSNSWRNLDDTHAIPFPFEITGDSFQLWTYVNNCCHWWGYVYESDNNENSDVENVVLSFDMVSELFRKIKVPKVSSFSSGICRTTLAAFSESATIGLIAYPIRGEGTEEKSFCFQVWVMKDYWDEGSWIKQYNYSVGPVPVIHNQLLGFYGTNRFLWRVHNTNETLVVLYQPDCEQHTRVLQVHGKPESIIAARYLESLVSLQRGNQSSCQLKFFM